MGVGGCALSRSSARLLELIEVVGCLLLARRDELVSEGEQRRTKSLTATPSGWMRTTTRAMRVFAGALKKLQPRDVGEEHACRGQCANTSRRRRRRHHHNTAYTARCVRRRHSLQGRGMGLVGTGECDTHDLWREELVNCKVTASLS